MGKFAEINHTYEIGQEALERFLIDLFRKEENIGPEYDVKISFQIGEKNTDPMDRFPGISYVKGATFIVTKSKKQSDFNTLDGAVKAWQDR
jgi:hypothetical protein